MRKIAFAIGILAVLSTAVVAGYDPHDGSNYSCNELNAQAQALKPAYYLLYDQPTPDNATLQKALQAKADYVQFCQAQDKQTDAVRTGN